ncbi:MAG: hypothetical protein ACLTT1_12545, partial [[Clostridium] scindens]
KVKRNLVLFLNSTWMSGSSVWKRPTSVCDPEISGEPSEFFFHHDTSQLSLTKVLLPFIVPPKEGARSWRLSNPTDSRQAGKKSAKKGVVE